MNKIKIKESAVTLGNLNKGITDEERRFIESEKKYYRVIVALRKNREKLGLTQEKLAQMSQVPRTTITKVESGSRNATLHTIMALAQAMGKSVELRLVQKYSR